ANLNLNIGQDQTRTASTHDTVLYAEDLILNTGVVNQGSDIVGATSVDIVCTHRSWTLRRSPRMASTCMDFALTRFPPPPNSTSFRAVCLALTLPGECVGQRAGSPFPQTRSCY